MAALLRALIVEDNERDAALLLRELRRGYDPVAQRVETPEAMGAALDAQPWDVVLSDYSMPRFSAPDALALVKEKGLDLPFIIISGTVGEETAVEAMRAGAHDFMIKGGLARLLPAIERELREAAVRAERRRMQEQLLISDRMVSVGTLAAGVAHEINNPLTVLIANLDFAVEGLGTLAEEARASASPARVAALAAQAQEPLRGAQDAADRVRLIVRDLKSLSGAGDEDRYGPVQIRDVLERSIRMAGNEIRHRAGLVRDYGDVPPVNGNESRLGQVFLNLIINAAQAIPEGRADENQIRVATRLGEGGSVVIEVSDSGSGIPADLLPRIFDPFFTTKPAGLGTGLGLAICRRIVSELGGEICVESRVGEGSAFRVVLPPARGVVAAPLGSESPPVEAGRRARILVVDDEPALCAMIVRMLGASHDVVAVTAAREALRVLAAGAQFDIILCDLMMPEMTGMDLYESLQRISPDQVGKIIFMTGGAFTPNARGFLDRVHNRRIDKPFTAKAVRSAIQEQLR
jgi:signal transduction histidine kinase